MENPQVRISSNLLNVISRIVGIVLVVLILYLFITFKDEFVRRPDKDIIWGLYILILIFLFLLVVLIISLCGIINVQLDKIQGTIMVDRFFSKQTISVNEIIGYYNSYAIDKFKTFNGILILLNNHSSFELNEYNLKSVVDIEKYLIEIKVECLGKKKFWFPFKTKV